MDNHLPAVLEPLYLARVPGGFLNIVNNNKSVKRAASKFGDMPLIIYHYVRGNYIKKNELDIIDFKFYL